MDKPKISPTNLILYGVLGLFAIIILVSVVARSLADQSKETPAATRAIQELALTEQPGIQSPENPSTSRMSATAPGNSSLLSNSPSPDPNSSQVSGTGTSVLGQAPPAGGTPPGANSSAGPTRGSTTGSPPSAVTPPPGGQTTVAQGSPPSNGTPPPTLQSNSTQSGPPPNGSPPPTLQRTATQSGPPVGGTPPPTPLPVGQGTYNDTHIAWQYSAGWNYYSGAGPFNDDFHYTGTPGNYVDLIFSGRKFSLTYTANPTRGLIDVYIDGDKVDTIDAYAAAITWQSIWTSEMLSNGTHTVRFVHAGGGVDRNIDIDAITIMP